jgi:hypothetical protein
LGESLSVNPGIGDGMFLTAQGTFTSLKAPVILENQNGVRTTESIARIFVASTWKSP